MLIQPTLSHVGKGPIRMSLPTSSFQTPTKRNFDLQSNVKVLSQIANTVEAPSNTANMAWWDSKQYEGKEQELRREARIRRRT